MAILSQFIFRLAFGLALAMAVTPAGQVTAGFFRIHAYVLLGLHALVACVAVTSEARFSLAVPLIGAAASYAVAVATIYSRPRAGTALLAVVAAASIGGAWLAAGATTGAAPVTTSSPAPLRPLLEIIDPVAGGLLLGFTIAAMLLGHWYLNQPGMSLAPLRRLLMIAAAALAFRGVVAAVALGLELSFGPGLATGPALFLLLRWLAGIAAPAAVFFMAHRTLAIPNTQSATGILYVGVITTFLGELTALLLSADALYPL